MTNRITRGFSRLAIGAAGLVALAGVGITSVAAASEYRANDGWVEVGTGIPANWASPAAAEAAGIGLAVTAVLALAAFGFCWGLGWVLAGFARD